MKQEDYVSYDVAMLLREKGFDEICDMAYTIGDKDSFHRIGEELVGHWNSSNSSLVTEVTAPLLYVVQKWLREKHQIGVFIQFDFDEYDKEPFGYSFDILDLKTNNLRDFCMEFTTYEKALNKGIKRALKKI